MICFQQRVQDRHLISRAESEADSNNCICSEYTAAFPIYEVPNIVDSVDQVRIWEHNPSV